VEELTKTTLIELAEEFGLPWIDRSNTVTVIGTEQLLVFKYLEETQCQLIEIL
jgi:hypothetical protein